MKIKAKDSTTCFRGACVDFTGLCQSKIAATISFSSSPTCSNQFDGIWRSPLTLINQPRACSETAQKW